MNSANIQLVLALVCVAVAAGSILWRLTRLLRGSGTGCGTGQCGSCPSKANGPERAGTGAPAGFVPLEQLTSGTRRES